MVFLKLQGVKTSHVVIYKWIRKYIVLMEKYLEQIKPNVTKHDPQTSYFKGKRRYEIFV